MDRARTRMNIPSSERLTNTMLLVGRSQVKNEDGESALCQASVRQAGRCRMKAFRLCALATPSASPGRKSGVVGVHMPSPFPRMDPYLEGELWTNFHTQFAVE